MNLQQMFKRDLLFIVILLFLVSCGGQGEGVAVVETAAVQPTSAPTLEPTATALPEPTATPRPVEPTATALPEPTATPRPILEAQLGDNHGTVPSNEVDVWNYVGQAGELLFVNLAIETPGEDQRRITPLHPGIFVTSPDGNQRGQKIYNPALNPHPVSDIFIFAGPLPEDGSYQIEVRSYQSNEPSNYTLTIESKRIEVDINISEEYVGNYIEEPGLDVEVYVEGDQLFGSILQTGATYHLIPISETTFFAADGTLTTYLRDDAGDVVGYEVWPFHFRTPKPVPGKKVIEQP
ncbi:MAG: hypothetical protein KC423_08155 [Anaerolineales bacterium]|nr:hypothetical protein [Anaerolineales bacterium]